MSFRCATKLGDKQDTILGVPLDVSFRASVAVIGGQNESHIFPYASRFKSCPKVADELVQGNQAPPITKWMIPQQMPIGLIFQIVNERYVQHPDVQE